MKYLLRDPIVNLYLLFVIRFACEFWVIFRDLWLAKWNLLWRCKATAKFCLLLEICSLPCVFPRGVVTFSMFVSCSFQGREFWTVSVTSVENTMGRWIREKKPACRQRIQVFYTAIFCVIWLSCSAIVDLPRPMWFTRQYCFWQRNTIRRVYCIPCVRFHFISWKWPRKSSFVSLSCQNLELYVPSEIGKLIWQLTTKIAILIM